MDGDEGLGGEKGAMNEAEIQMVRLPMSERSRRQPGWGVGLKVWRK